MSRAGSGLHAVLSLEAKEDLRNVLRWSARHFGAAAAARYSALLKQTLRDLEVDPERAGSRAVPEIAMDLRLYHIALSRRRGPDQVKAPRHLMVYRVRAGTLEIVRILYDSTDLPGQLEPDLADD